MNCPCCYLGASPFLLLGSHPFSFTEESCALTTGSHQSALKSLPKLLCILLTNQVTNHPAFQPTHSCRSHLGSPSLSEQNYHQNLTYVSRFHFLISQFLFRLELTFEQHQCELCSSSYTWLFTINTGQYRKGIFSSL